MSFVFLSNEFIKFSKIIRLEVDLIFLKAVSSPGDKSSKISKPFLILSNLFFLSFSLILFITLLKKL